MQKSGQCGDPKSACWGTKKVVYLRSGFLWAPVDHYSYLALNDFPSMLQWLCTLQYHKFDVIDPAQDMPADGEKEKDRNWWKTKALLSKLDKERVSYWQVLVI